MDGFSWFIIQQFKLLLTALEWRHRTGDII